MPNTTNAVSIVLLDDGDTWSGDAERVTLTQEGYDMLMDGTPFRHIPKEHIVLRKSVWDTEDNK